MGCHGDGHADDTGPSCEHAAGRPRTDRRDDRIKEHLAAMRSAIARGDFATADSELNAVSRVDVGNPELRKARREVEQAREEAQKKQKQN